MCRLNVILFSQLIIIFGDRIFHLSERNNQTLDLYKQ